MLRPRAFAGGRPSAAHGSAPGWAGAAASGAPAGGVGVSAEVAAGGASALSSARPELVRSTTASTCLRRRLRRLCLRMRCERHRDSEHEQESG